MIVLRPRLLALAHRVRQGARVVDVGTDHGRLPLWLLQHGVTVDVTAVDIAEGPLSRARALAARCGLENSLLIMKSDGLKALQADSYDCIVVAGMGGDTIKDILCDCPWALEKHLLLQPMTRFFELASWLDSRGVCVETDTVLDSGRHYNIIEVKND